MKFRSFPAADRIAKKNGYKKLNGRIFFSSYREKFICVVKLDGIIQAFGAFLPKLPTPPKTVRRTK